MIAAPVPSPETRAVAVTWLVGESLDAWASMLTCLSLARGDMRAARAWHRLADERARMAVAWSRLGRR